VQNEAPQRAAGQFIWAISAAIAPSASAVDLSTAPNRATADEQMRTHWQSAAVAHLRSEASKRAEYRAPAALQAGQSSRSTSGAPASSSGAASLIGALAGSARLHSMQHRIIAAMPILAPILMMPIVHQVPGPDPRVFRPRARGWGVRWTVPKLAFDENRRWQQLGRQQLTRKNGETRVRVRWFCGACLRRGVVQLGRRIGAEGQMFAQPPPEQSIQFVTEPQVELSWHSIVQLPPEQSKLHDAAPAHVWWQLAPTQLDA
jgi:hypothetical protein